MARSGISRWRHPGYNVAATARKRGVMPSFDVIVLGLGAMGSATAYQLAKRGSKVLGIDRFAPPHVNGSTHGETRITRLACGEGRAYTQFARRSHEIWRELEGATGRELLTQNGLIVISGEGPRAANHEKPDFLKVTIDIAKAEGIAHEVLSGRDARARFPAFRLNDSDIVYYEPGAGFVRPEPCVSAQLDVAARLGAKLHTGETVRSFAPAADHVSVVTDRATYTAATLVVTAGPWLPELMGEPLASLFRVRRQVLFWYAGEAPAYVHENFRPEKCPVYIWQIPAPQAIYGFPAIDGPEQGAKIATEQYLHETTPDAVDRTVSEQEIRDMHATYVEPFFPGLGPRCVRTAVCLYTCVDRARFIIDFHPASRRVIVASPCSGHGFKHSAAIGEALSQFAIEGKTRFDLGAFAL
jgi:sarcosine oxidase